MTALILHGGAGARRERNYDAEVVHMREVVEAMKVRLDAGDSALDVATAAVVMLEDSGLYVAGKGASPNLAGAYELDASIMDGSTKRAGAVAALQGFRNPVVAARATGSASSSATRSSASSISCPRPLHRWRRSRNPFASPWPTARCMPTTTPAPFSCTSAGLARSISPSAELR